MKRKTTISKSEKEPFKWETWTNLGIQIILVLITVFSFYETQKSTKAAQESVALQRQQYEDAQKQESQKSLEDSEKRKKDIELIEQQIAALKEQASAIKEGTKNTEISQRPFVDIVQFGYHSADDNNQYVLKYKISNNGIRPLVLKKVKLYVLGEQFNFIKLIQTTHNHRLVRDMVVDQRLQSSKGNEMVSLVSKEEILAYSNVYYFFMIYYYDPFLKKYFNTNNTPITFKWVNRQETDLFLSINGNVKYLGFESCSDIEESKIVKTIYQIKED
ncbi:MAG: hypothetical protein KA138_00100 [Saprospiraceae bacterium]|nr:hypothetical protein [Saprospiraceae bacterium]